MIEAHALRLLEEVWIDAPPERVYRALSDPNEIVKWWAVPEAYGTTAAEIDLREGGRYVFSGWSRGLDTFEVTGTYLVVEPPHRLAYTWSPGWDADAAESRVEFTLRAEDGGTRVRVEHTAFRTAKSRDDHASGWPAVLGELRGYLEEVA